MLKNVFFLDLKELLKYKNVYINVDIVYNIAT